VDDDGPGEPAWDEWPAPTELDHRADPDDPADLDDPAEWDDPTRWDDPTGWDGADGWDDRRRGYEPADWGGSPSRPGDRGAVTSQPQPARSRLWRYARRGALAVLAAVVVFALAFGLLLLLTPSTSDAERRVSATETAHGGQPLTGPLPTKVVEALVATEDSRFYSHHGIDPLGAVRGITAPLIGGDQGGATLDQQLVKILYTGGRRNTVDQIEQTALAVKLDARYSKTDILRMYLDTVYFGHGYYGLTRAAEGYFGVAPSG
jgi:penicillin-binding protein 1A